MVILISTVVQHHTARGTLRDTHRTHVYYVNGRVTHGGHEIVGELFHDHEIVWNVTYESLWDNLGMSDIILMVQDSDLHMYI